MKHCFILNPAAGKGALAEQIKPRIEKICSDRQTDYEIYMTAGVKDASEYVKRRVAEDPTEEYRFYACGGDGTLCEVVNGVMRLENREKISVGLIPSGTGNDFVRNFTHRDQFFDVEAQIEGSPCKVDVLLCNDMYAINMINVGFDCEVVCKTSELKKHPLIPSKLAYIAGLVLTLIRKPGVRAKMVREGQEECEKQYLLNTYANGCFCGGGFYSNPRGSLTDGQIDALYVNNVSRTRFVSLVGDYKKGTHLSPKFEKVLKNEKISSIQLLFNGITNVSVDGEVIQTDKLCLSVCNRALRFVIPKGSQIRGETEVKASGAEVVS